MTTANLKRKYRRELKKLDTVAAHDFTPAGNARFEAQVAKCMKIRDELWTREQEAN